MRATKSLKIVAVALGVIGVLAASQVGPGPMSRTAAATTATANLTVTANIANTCSISTANVAFGTYDPVSTNASTPLDGTGTVTTTCTNGFNTAKITLSQGANPAGGSTTAVPLRRMVNGGNFMSYFLYQDSGRTTVWGDTPATSPASLTATGSAQNTTVYGRVTAGQTTLPAASYSDTVVATITF
jgi:spore coat protein U-like protein